MKTIILLLIPFISVCQTTEIIFNSTTEARVFADSLIALSSDKHTFLKDKIDEKKYNFRIWYIPENLTVDEVAQQKDNGCEKCAKIDFTIQHIGANADLKQAGIIKYRFTNFSGTYLTVYPAWQRYFNAEADIEKTNMDYFKTNAAFDNGIRIQKHMNSWRIFNYNL